MSDEPVDPPSQSSPAWVTFGVDTDEDFIIGSPAGLRVLRDHIDKALKEGESCIEDPRIEFNGFRCKQSMEDVPAEPGGSSLAAYGCLALGIAVLALAVYGLMAVLR